MSVDRVSGNRLVRKADEVSGVRVWPDGSEPSIGAWFGAPAPRTCIAREMTRSYQGDSPTNPIWTVQYSTRQNEEQAGDYDRADEFLPRRVSFAGEGLNLGRSKVAVFTASGDSVDQDVYKRVGMMTIELTKIYTSWQTMVSFLWTRLGRISASAFNGIPGAYILFDSAEAEEYEDPDGNGKRWRVNATFLAREQPWNHLYNPATGAWEEVKVNGQLIYQEADFSFSGR